jgi:ferric-dicitrate binding protein FerR (iron transport regulator)
VAGDRTSRVREAVRLEWQASTRHRRSRFRRGAVAATALLATAAAIALAVRFNASREAAVPAPPLAIVERVDGRFRFEPGEGVPAGEWLETHPGTRASFRLGDHTSLRLDSGSRARLISPTVIELSSGAVYVDTGESSPGLEVRTPLGTARDTGTQFEVRLRDTSLQVRVRSGAVELRHGAGSTSAPAGTELTLADGRALRAKTSAFGPAWEWASGVAPAFPIEGRPLSVFLDHLAHEHGWTVRYADASLAARASTIVLRGSVDGLSPQDALTVAIATSGLAHRLQNGQISVLRP